MTGLLQSLQYTHLFVYRVPVALLDHLAQLPDLIQKVSGGINGNLTGLLQKGLGSRFKSLERFLYRSFSFFQSRLQIRVSLGHLFFRFHNLSFPQHFLADYNLNNFKKYTQTQTVIF